MVATINRTDIPQWAYERMLLKCPYCGRLILDNSDTGVTTARRCGNPQCPGHMSFRLAALADRFHIKGIGDKTALDIINTYKLTSHLQVLPMWFGEEKPVVSLAEYVSMCEIEGYGTTSAGQDLGEYSTPQEYFEKCQYPDPILVKNKKFLLENAQYFQFKPGLSRTKLYCMATGSFHGYADRQEFFDRLNNVFGQYVNVIQVGKRKSNVHFLVREEDAVDHSKTALAKENHIPIVTPMMLLALLNQQFPDALKMEEKVKEMQGGQNE